MTEEDEMEIRVIVSEIMNAAQGYGFMMTRDLKGNGERCAKLNDAADKLYEKLGMKFRTRQDL